MNTHAYVSTYAYNIFILPLQKTATKHYVLFFIISTVKCVYLIKYIQHAYDEFVCFGLTLFLCASYPYLHSVNWLHLHLIAVVIVAVISLPAPASCTVAHLISTGLALRPPLAYSPRSELFYYFPFFLFLFLGFLFTFLYAFDVDTSGFCSIVFISLYLSWAIGKWFVFYILILLSVKFFF